MGDTASDSTLLIGIPIDQQDLIVLLTFKLDALSPIGLVVEYFVAVGSEVGFQMVGEIAVILGYANLI